MGGEFVTRLISEVPIFSVLVLQKPPVVYKHFICSKFKEIGIYNRNVVKRNKKKNHLPSNMDMKILQNEDLCYFQNSGIDQCCVIFQFLISLSVLTDYLCMLLICDIIFFVCVFCKLRSLLTYLAHS